MQVYFPDDGVWAQKHLEDQGHVSEPLVCGTAQTALPRELLWRGLGGGLEVLPLLPLCERAEARAQPSEAAHRRVCKSGDVLSKWHGASSEARPEALLHRIVRGLPVSFVAARLRGTIHLRQRKRD